MRKIFRLVIVMTIVLVSVIATSSVVLASPPEKTSAFVCPVLKNPGNAPDHSPQIVPIGGGHYTVAASTTADHLYIPIHATNGNGTGTPPGPHSAPGDTDYTAIWAASD